MRTLTAETYSRLREPYETECWWAAYAFDNDVQADPRVLVANWYVDSPETHMENDDDFAAMVKCPKLSAVAVVEISELMRCGHLDASDIMAVYCREWRARKKLEREQAEEMVGAE